MQGKTAWLSICAMLAGLVHAATAGVYAWALGPFLGGILDSGGAVQALAWVLLATAALRAGASLLQHRCSRLTEQNVTLEVRLRLHAHLLRVDYGSLTGLPVGELGHRIATDFGALAGMLQGGVFTVARSLLTCAVLSGTAIAVAPSIAAVGLLGIPIPVYLFYRYARSDHSRYALVWDAQSKLAGRIASLTRLIPLLRVFGYTQEEQARFLTQAKELRSDMLGATRNLGKGSAVLEIFATAALVVAVFLATSEVSSGTLSKSEAITLLIAVWMAYRPIVALSSAGRAVARGLAAVDHVQALLSLPVESEAAQVPDTLHDSTTRAPDVSTPTSDNAQSSRKPTTLRAVGIGFAYPLHFRAALPSALPPVLGEMQKSADGQNEVLSELSLSIEPGERVGIAGASGEGKTTLLLLLMGILRPNRGEMTFGNLVRSQAPNALWQSNFAWVPQRPQLLRATILENITLGLDTDRYEPAEQRKRAADAAASAALAGAIKALPDGYDTQVQEDGAGLSLGFQQRLCLARALCSEAPVLVLDEPTASLDPDAEQTFLAHLDVLLAQEKRTVVLVSHRLSTLMRLDRVIFLKDGTIAEQGHAQTLLDSGGAFSVMFGRERMPMVGTEY